MNSSAVFVFLFAWGGVCSAFSLILIKLGFTNEAIFAIKDAVVYLAAIIFASFWITTWRAWSFLALSLLYLLYLFLNYFFLNFDYNAPIANIRQLYAPVILLIIFCTWKIGDDYLVPVWQGITMVFIVIVVWGLIELSFSLWPRVGLQEFFNLKGIPVDETGLSYMFYEPMLNYMVRMTSFFLDPISLGHFLATYVTFTYYLLGLRKGIILIILGIIGLSLTLSKGALFQLFLGVIFLNSIIPVALRIVAILIFVLAAAIVPDYLLTGIYIHLTGTYNAIVSLSMFGYGIGSVGNYTKMFSDDLTVYDQLGISDSYVGALLGQTGIIGLLLFSSICLGVIICSSVDRNNARIALILFASIFAVSIMSENTMNVTSFILPAMLIAYATKVPFEYFRSHK